MAGRATTGGGFRSSVRSLALPALLLAFPAAHPGCRRPAEARRSAAEEHLSPLTPKAGEPAVSDERIESDLSFLTERTKELLRGSIIPAADGTPLYTPDGKAHYAALWTRDFASMVEYAGDLMPLEDIRRCISYLVKGVRADGAYWATASGWVMRAVSVRSPALARRMFLDLVEDFRAGGICECVNEGYRQLESYVDSATNPLGAARALWRR